LAEEIAILVGLRLTSHSRKKDADTISADDSMEELKALAFSAGARVAETSIQARPKPDAATLIGSGKLEELKAQRHPNVSVHFGENRGIARARRFLTEHSRGDFILPLDDCIRIRTGERGPEAI